MVTSFNAAMKRDPRFAAEVAAARREAHESLEAIAIQRARFGTTRPIYHLGKKVGEEQQFDSKLLIFLLSRLNSPIYGDKKTVRIEGEIQHNHGHGISLHLEDMMLLTDSERDSFSELLEKIAERKESQKAKALPAPTGGDQVIDGEFEQVESAEDYDPNYDPDTEF